MTELDHIRARVGTPATYPTLLHQQCERDAAALLRMLDEERARRLALARRQVGREPRAGADAVAAQIALDIEAGVEP